MLFHQLLYDDNDNDNDDNDVDNNDVDNNVDNNNNDIHTYHLMFTIFYHFNFFFS